MKIEKKSSYILIALLSILITVALLVIAHKRNELNFINSIGLVGSVFSFAGILIAFIEIIYVRKISEESKLAIENAIDELFKSFSISDLSRNIKLITEIQNLVRSGKMEASLYKMQDLKSFLIQIDHVNLLSEKYDNDLHSKILTDLNIIILNLNSQLTGTKKDLDKMYTIDSLEKTSTFILELENKLKYHRNGR